MNELKDIIKLTGNNKARGPDGLPGELIKYGGNIVAEFLHPLIKNIWLQNYVPDNMKGACIVLIPKRKDSKEPQDMRPITLLNSMYKILDKIMTKRHGKNCLTQC